MAWPRNGVYVVGLVLFRRAQPISYQHSFNAIIFGFFNFFLLWKKAKRHDGGEGALHALVVKIDE